MITLSTNGTTIELDNAYAVHSSRRTVVILAKGLDTSQIDRGDYHVYLGNGDEPRLSKSCLVYVPESSQLPNHWPMPVLNAGQSMLVFDM